MSEVTPAWTTLNRFLPSRTADLDYWWKFSGRHLAIILDAAQYPMEKQYETLLFHYHWGAPYMGLAPRADKSPLAWRSLVQPDGTPIEYSWKWPSANSSGTPEVRFDIEPIGPYAGTEIDPLNQLASREMMGRLAACMPGVDNTWFNHFLATLYDHDNSKFKAEAAAGAMISSTVLVAAEFYPGRVVFKTYCQPRYHGCPGTTPIPLYDQAIAQLDPENAARLAVNEFLATSAEGKLMSPFSIGVDNLAPGKARLKWYFNSPHTSFNSVREIMTLGGRILTPHMERQLLDLNELIKTVLGLPADFPDDAEVAEALGARSPYPFPMPDEVDNANKETPSPVLPGWVYYFEVAPGQALPQIKYSIPLRNFRRDDLGVAKAFMAFLESRGRGKHCAQYMEMLRRLAADEGSTLEDSNGLQAFISILFRADGELDITSYFAGQAFEPRPKPEVVEVVTPTTLQKQLFSLSPEYVGVFHAAEIAPGALELCNELLQKNHEAYHIFYRDPSFHNHMVHSLLTCLTLGASPEELTDRYNDLTPIQRQIPDVDEGVLGAFSDPEVIYRTIGQIHQYHTFLEFFKREIAAKGWRDIVQEYVFSRSKVADRMLAQMIEGAYHPLIHLGFGIEFELPTVIAEALAQAASHDRMLIEQILFEAEREAAANPLSADTSPPSLIELAQEIRATETIRTAARWSDLGNKMKDGVVGRAGDAISKILAKFQIDNTEEALDRRTAEMISTAAYLAGAAHKEGRKRKMDFFIMHAVTSSIFGTVIARQAWIRLEDKVRLIEWKSRLDLAWYAATGCAELQTEAISEYSDPNSDGLDWQDLFRLVRAECDDGHAAKFIRALNNGESVSKQYEESGKWADYFPVKGDMWLRMARLCQDSTTKLPWECKWVFATGFDEAWQRPDLAGPPTNKRL